MSETQKEEENRRPGISGLAVASISLAALGLAVFAWRLLAYRPWWSEYVARNIAPVLGFVGLMVGCLALARISKRIATIAVLIASSPFLLILCSYLLVGFPRSRAFGYSVQRSGVYLTTAFFLILLPVLTTRQWRSWLRGRSGTGTFATLGMAIGVVLMILWWVETCGPVSTALRMVCGHNLKRIGDAMKVYADDNGGRYPDPNQWCDLLLQHTDIDADRLLCPEVKWRWHRQVLPFPVPKNKRCYYAVNSSCEPNSPDDVVLLFEIRGGWNMSGGPELITAGNHRGLGCMLFNDGRMESMREQDFDKLNWDIEEKDNESIDQQGTDRTELEGDSI